MTYYARGAQIPDATSPWGLNVVRRRLIFVGPLYRNSSRHPSGAQNFDMAPRFLESLCTVELCINIKQVYSQQIALIKNR